MFDKLTKWLKREWVTGALKATSAKDTCAKKRTTRYIFFPYSRIVYFIEILLPMVLSLLYLVMMLVIMLVKNILKSFRDNVYDPHAKRMMRYLVRKVKANEMFHEENKLQEFVSCCGSSDIKK